MSQNATCPPRVIGDAVGKDEIVVADSAAEPILRLANTPEGLAAFVRRLGDDCLVVCEATGGHETALLLAALDAGVSVHRADARKLKAFIRSRGTLGKTDVIDAQALVRYGQECHAELPRWQPAGGVHDELCTLIRLRAQLVKQRAALTNQLKAPGGGIAKKHLQAMIDAATARIAKIEADIDDLVHHDPATAEIITLIEDIPGCGRVTAVTVAALMPEIGTLTGRQAASLAGLAPHPHQSGQRDGYRRTRGGRPEVCPKGTQSDKRALFMAAMAARNHNPTLKAVYERLLQNGKKPIVALTALVRKLITIINARVRDAQCTSTA